MISRRGLLGLGVAGIATHCLAPAWAEAPDRSPRPPRRPSVRADTGGVGSSSSAEALVRAAKLGGATSFVVIDAKTGAVLEALDPDMPVPPASVAKTVTALFALDTLGPSFRFRTRVLATGPTVGGVVQGDLVLVGDGDPTLQTDQLGDLVAAVAARGISGVTGRFLVWDKALPAIGRIAEDQPIHVGYNPALGGLNLNFNRVHFEWRRDSGGWGLAMDARGERFVPPVRMARVKVKEREAPLFTYASQGSEEDWTVASAALGKGGSRWLPVRHPTAYVAEVFQTLAKAQGIKLPPSQIVDVRPEGTEIAVAESGPLTDVLRDMLKFSTNITAECVGLRASGRSDLVASSAAMEAWAQQRYAISQRYVDHSGLGASSRVTAQDMARLLAGARSHGAGLVPLLRNVGIRDAKGKEIKGHPVQVLAKSGTLNFVSGLAGHILPPSGRELIFAVFSADVARREALPEAERESPPGGKEWTRRARNLQAQLVSRWAETFA